jgi:hypothetical protein
MSENPFKIIRSTDQPPGDLRKEVMGSVKFMMLLMRFLQLFAADPGPAMFENVRMVGRSNEPKTDPPSTEPTPDTK